MNKFVLNEIVNNVIKKYVNESQGVVENNMEAFAEYLWQRCRNNKVRPNKYGDVNFTLPSKQWNKFNTYNLYADKIQVCITDRLRHSDATFSLWHNKPIIEISTELLYDTHEKFISTIMHELTHFINILANNKLKTKNRKFKKITRSMAMPRSYAGNIEYLYDKTEMNARLTGAYYYLKGELENNRTQTYILIESFKEGEVDRQFVLQKLFNISSKITRYYEMEKQMKTVYNDNNNPYYDPYKSYVGQLYGDEILNNEEPNSITAHLRYGNNSPNKEHTIQQYFKRRLDMTFFMQKELENFKVRIYKMIYKFMDDVL